MLVIQSLTLSVMTNLKNKKPNKKRDLENPRLSFLIVYNYAFGMNLNMLIVGTAVKHLISIVTWPAASVTSPSK